MKAYSIDLRERVVRSAQNGRGQSWIAREFGIALGTVKGYLKRYQTDGTLQLTRQRREQPRIGETDLPALQAQVDAHPDATIAQHIDYWAVSHGLRVGQATMCRALQRANRPLKKTLRAAERDEGERVLFQDLAQTLAVSRLVVIDESGSQVGMSPVYARAPAGERAYSTSPFNKGHNYSLLAALRSSGLSAPLVIEGAVNGAVFETYVREVLGPTLHPGDLVLMDNVAFHKADAIEALIEACGASILWLPSYSPDLSPIEPAFGKLKACIRRAKAATLDALLDAIAQGCEAITESDVLSWFIHCGFLNIDQAT